MCSFRYHRCTSGLGVLLIFSLSGVGVGRAAGLLPPGFRPLPLGVHALVGARVVPAPGKEIAGGTILIRDGLIEAVGNEVAVPADARVWNFQGLTIYAGFIDPLIVPPATNAPAKTPATEPDCQFDLTSPAVKFFGAPGAQTDMGAAGPGAPVAGVKPEYRLAQHYTPRTKELEPLRDLGFAAGVMAPANGIVRGTSALVLLTEENPNELILKPEVFQHVSFDAAPATERAYPRSLMGIIATVRQTFLDARHYATDWDDFRAHSRPRPRPPFDPALEALQPVIARKIPVLFEPGSALLVDRAARIARELDIDFCLVASGQEWRRPDLAQAAGAGFIVPLDFPELPKMPEPEDWDQVGLDPLRAWDWAAENPALLRSRGLEIALTTFGLKDKKKFHAHLRRALDRGLSETDALAALTVTPARLCGAAGYLGTIEPGKLANLTVVQGGGYFEPEARVHSVWIEGRIHLPSQPPPPNNTAGVEASETGKPPTGATAKPLANEKASKSEALRAAHKLRVARSPLEGRGPVAEPRAVLVKEACLWTCGTGGVLTNADLLVVGGKIKVVGAGSVRSDYPGPPLVIEGRGLHVTPGLIDAHSHTAILGAVNESTLPSTAMVRIADVVNSETDNLYQQLAGGVTTVNLYHGSANPIGGQSCVIKLRDGAPPQELIFDAAPPGIKFALGENVKQANWGDKAVTRFPQTRMGVRAFLANRFTAARQYLATWEDFRAGRLRPGAPIPRRDLELEALGEILQGKRWIHCHAYRQDEILMMLRLMEEFGVTVGTFEHGLEGYKVADEIAWHGAGVSTFADWWAYKFEVYDAIPYNGALMHQRGVLVSFNSDSSEMARRLYGEAAKAVKFGGLAETEALKLVTLNPAKQLRIDSRVGSLEPGKDADFVIWSGPPLDATSRCLQTWIEGRKYFDQSLASERAGRLAREREELVAKARKIQKLSAAGASHDEAPDHTAFFQTCLEHQYDGVQRDCMDDVTLP